MGRPRGRAAGQRPQLPAWWRLWRAVPEDLRLEHGPAIADLAPARPAPAGRMERIVTVQPGLLLRLLFSDGTAGDVDFSAERWTGVLEPLNDPAYFAEVIVDPEAGTIAWPNGIDLAPEPLYEQARAHRLIAA